MAQIIGVICLSLVVAVLVINSCYMLISPRRWFGLSEWLMGVPSGRCSMAHTYASNFVHCVFSAKGRRSLIPAGLKFELYAYLGGIARGEGFSLIAAGGTENHIHLLLLLPPTYSLAQAVQKLKGSSSRWMGKGFFWQEGYGAFSVSPSQIEAVKGYIRDQEQHHRKRSSEQEFVALLRNCGIEYDERYVFG